MVVKNVYENGYINDSDGKMQLANSVTLQSWLELRNSFTVKTSAGKFTVRKESRKRGDGYWAMYKKVQGKLKKRYLGMSQEVTQQLIEDAVNSILNDIPLPSKVTQQLPKEVTQLDAPTLIDEYLNQSGLLSTGRDAKAVRRCRDWITAQTYASDTPEA